MSTQARYVAPVAPARAFPGDPDEAPPRGLGLGHRGYCISRPLGSLTECVYLTADGGFCCDPSRADDRHSPCPRLEAPAKGAPWFTPGLSICWAYRPNGAVCRAPAVGVDGTRGCTVCAEHMPQASVAVVVSSLTIGGIAVPLEDDGKRGWEPTGLCRCTHKRTINGATCGDCGLPLAPRPHVPAHVADWRRLCEWLYAFPGHAAYVGAMPTDLQWLVTSRRTWNGDRDRLVFYMSGWGWRLRRGWRKELERREALATTGAS